MKQEQIRTIKIVVAYDGSDFIGWQRQNLPGGKQRSVQATLEQAFRQLSGETIVLHGAGRTDAGVHSLGQVASFRTQTAIPLERLQLAWNRQLPGDVRVLQCQEMPMGFHARYDAIGKQYQYFFSLQKEISPFQFQHVYHCPYALDLPKMQEDVYKRQGHYTVNGKKVDIASYVVRVGDEIAIKEKSRSSAKFAEIAEALAHKQIPAWLDVDKANLCGKVVAIPTREDIDIPITEQLVVELYSR